MIKVDARNLYFMTSSGSRDGPDQGGLPGRALHGRLRSEHYLPCCRPGGSNWQHPKKVVRFSLTELASGKFSFQLFNENLENFDLFE